MDQAQNLRNIVKQKNLEMNESTPTEGKARVIVVTSGKGGVGKSSVSINLAIQFRKQNKKVIIFDADFGLANIEVMFGAIPQYNLADLIYKGKDIKDIIATGPMDIGFISGGSGINSLMELSKDQITYLVHKLKELEDMTDILIVDTGAGISNSVMDFVVSAREILLVTTPEPTSITDSYSLLKALTRHEDYDKENIVVNLIANKVNTWEEGQNLYNKLNMVVERFLNIHFKFLGTVEQDANIPKSIIQQKPISMIYPNSKASKNFAQIADAILEKREVSEKEKSGLSYMFSRMFHKR